MLGKPSKKVVIVLFGAILVVASVFWHTQAHHFKGEAEPLPHLSFASTGYANLLSPEQNLRLQNLALLADDSAIVTGVGTNLNIFSGANNLTGKISNAANNRLAQAITEGGYENLADRLDSEAELAVLAEADYATYIFFDTNNVKDIGTNRKYTEDYIRLIATILGEHSAALFDTNSAVVLNQWLETEDDSHLNELLPIGLAYEQAALELAELGVPRDIVPLHAALTDTFFQIAWSIDQIMQSKRDPLRAMFGAAHFTGHRSRQADVLVALNQRLHGLLAE